MASEIEGLDEFQRKLDDLADKAQRLDGSHEVPLNDVLSASFLAESSRFRSLDELFGASGFTVSSREDLERIPDAEWDAFIKANTSFNNWKEMLHAGAADWTRRQLGL